ncbi:hypothetical protein J5J83_07690 [Azoarcus sp. L1K30]|uniref:hypothetical protein n=1 Tax=Azoarcus sp. L1K30 TaxID=2820277 RepID=UPI001B836393|nr:hypothetical protein [Azoarcus sp. L1K30]MBR0565994.1 hypothetical protein [Azoarcus sp. L1K30]
MLLDLPEVTILLQELRQEFEATDLRTLYSAYLDRFNSVTDWKFSSGDYFSPIPYESERMGFSSDFLIKKKYKSVDEARWLGKYCAGFVNGRHVITVLPSQRTVKALHATLYDEADSILEMHTVSFKWIGKPEKMQSQVRGIRKVISRPDNTKLDVVVGLAGAFSINLYQYSKDGRPVSVRALSKGWTGEDQLEYRYTSDGRLDEITAGGPIPLWKRKK